MALTEREVLQKWGNGTRNKDVSLGDIFHLCQDVMIARTDESSWKEPEPILLQSATGAEYDRMALQYKKAPGSVKTEGIWIHSLEDGELGDSELEVEITSSILVERDFRRGREKFNVNIVAVPVYSPLIRGDLAEDSIISVILNSSERRELFLGIKGALLATILAENDQPASA